jgi:excisionase family DNA binding protein
MTEAGERPYLTLHEAAERLQRSVDDCYRMVRTGELQYVRVGRSIRIPFYAVEGLLSMNAAMVATAPGAGIPKPPATQAAPPPAGTDRVDAPAMAPLAADADGTQAGDPLTVRPPESPWSQVPVVIQTASRGPRRRGGTLAGVRERLRRVRILIPALNRPMAALVVSDSNLRAVVVNAGKVRAWASVLLKDGVVRDGAVVDAPSFLSALGALEAKLGGPRLARYRLGVVTSGRSLVTGRFQAALPEGPDRDAALRRLLCEKLSVRPDDVTVDYYSPDSRPGRRPRRRKVGTGESAVGHADAEVFGIATLRSVTDSVAAQLAAARARVAIAQPKPVSLAAASAIEAGIIVDIEPSTVTVIIVRGGFVDVVRDVSIEAGLHPQQLADIIAGQVNRSVGYYNARYPDSHLPAGSPILTTGEGAVDTTAAELALATLPYSRRTVAIPFGAPDGFPAGAYAAALGAVQQQLARRAGPRSSPARPSFDFLPEEYRPRPLPVKRLALVSAATVLALGFVPVYQAVADVSSRTAALAASVSRLEPQVRERTAQLREIAAIQESLRLTNASVEKFVAAELAIEGDDRAFGETFSRVRAALPPRVNLGEVDDDGTLVEIAASAVNPDDIFVFVRALSAVDGFSQVRIRSIALDGSGMKATLRLTRDTSRLVRASAAGPMVADDPTTEMPGGAY